MNRFYRISILLAFSLALMALAGAALAHEPRTIGPYDVEVGWQNEPPYTWQLNAVELYVEKDKEPVEDVDKTLTLEVIYGNSKAGFPLEPVEGDPGHYVAVILPTRPGDYTFHFTGKIGGTAIDEKFTSADGKFESVTPSGDIAFPDQGEATPNPSLADLQRQVDELKAEVDALKSALATPGR